MKLNARRSSSATLNRFAMSRSSTFFPVDPYQPTVINATALPRSVSYANNINTNAPTSSTTTTAHHSHLQSSYDRLSSDSSSNNSTVSDDKRLTRPDFKDSLARDPFVSISRAIQSAKLRAASTLRSKSINSLNTPSNSNKYYGKSSRSRQYMYSLARKISRLILFIVLISVLISFIVRSLSKTHKQEQKKQPPKTTSGHFWPRSLFSSSPKSSSKVSSTSITITTQSDAINRIHSTTLKNSFSPGFTASLSSLDYFKRHRPLAIQNQPTLSTGPWLIALVSDLDKESCRERDLTSGKLIATSCVHANAWVSYLKRGILDLKLQKSRNSKFISITNKQDQMKWLDEVTLESGRPLDTIQRNESASGNRAMELSELAWFHGRLLAPDDRTGALLEISSPHGDLHDTQVTDMLPGKQASHVPPSTLHRMTLRGGDGSINQAAFKAEWMVVKDDELVIGGHGRPYTDAQGAVLSENPLWVKIVSRNKNGEEERKDNAGLEVKEHVNWTVRYEAVRKALGIQSPGYIMHEAVLWSHERREWVMLPRRCSKEAFDSRTFDRKGCNKIVIANEGFSDLRSIVIGGLKDETSARGFSAAAFVPGSGEHVVVAVRTVELEGEEADVSGVVGGGKERRNGKWARVTESYMSVFDVTTGDILMDEMKVSDLKYEGLAIL